MQKPLYFFIFIFLCTIFIFYISINGNSANRLILIGGNTVCQYEYDDEHIIKKSGWSEYITNYVDNKVKIINLSKKNQTLQSFIDTGLNESSLGNLSKDDNIILQIEKADLDSETLINNVAEMIDLSNRTNCKLYISLPLIENIRENEELASKISQIKDIAQENNITIISSMFVGYMFGHDKKIVLSYYKNKELGYDYDGLNYLFADAVASHISNVVYEGEDSFPQSACKVTRGMFVGQLMKLSNYEPKNKDVFNDVNPSNEFYGEIAAAKDLGVISGFQDGSFHPDEEITLGDASVIAVKLLRCLDDKYNVSMFCAGVSDPEMQQLIAKEHAEEKNMETYAIPYAYDLSFYCGATTVWYNDKLSKNIAISDIYQLFYDDIYMNN